MQFIQIEPLYDDNIRRFIVPLVKTGRIGICAGTNSYWVKLELCDMYLTPEALYYGIQYLNIVAVVVKFIDYCKYVSLVGFEPSKVQQIEEYKKLFDENSGWVMANLNPELIFQIFTEAKEIILQLVGYDGIVMSAYDTTFIKFSRCISDKGLAITQRSNSGVNGFELHQSYIKSIYEDNNTESYSQRIEWICVKDSKCTLCIDSLSRGSYDMGNIVLKNANVTLKEQQVSLLAAYLKKSINFLSHTGMCLPPTAIISSSSTSSLPNISTFSNKDLSVCGHIYPNPSVLGQQIKEGLEAYKGIEVVDVLVEEEHLKAFLDSLKSTKENLHPTGNKDFVVSLYSNNQKKVLNTNHITQGVPVVQLEDCCLKYSHFDLNIDIIHRSVPGTCHAVQIPFIVSESAKVRTFETFDDIEDFCNIQEDSLAFKVVRKIIETCDWGDREDSLEYYSTVTTCTPCFLTKSLGWECRVGGHEITVLENLVNFLRSITFTYSIAT